jgi:type VI secretion system protein ImpH
MTVAFMGLTGPLGVLPHHYTELLMARVSRQDQALGDFLDLFHHRFLSLFYRAWEKHHVAVAYERAMVRNQEADLFSRSLFAWIGLGTAGLQNRLEVADATLLFYAGLLVQHPHSASALTGLLQDYFGVRVEVVQFTGQWLPLTAEHRSCLGEAQGHNNALGVNTVLGHRVWDQQATFTLRLGPLTYPEFIQFLPTGRAFRSLVQLTRFFAGQECDFAVQLVLKAAEVPWCRLGERGEGAPRLGWSTWLKTRALTRDATETMLTVNDL